MSPEEKQQGKIAYKRTRTFPVNELDSSWLATEPDYTGVQNEYDRETTFVKIFSLFNSGVRLSNISVEEARLCEYNLITAGMCLDEGLKTLGTSVFFDVASLLETRQSKKGFRTEAMNKITQELKNFSDSEKKTILGGKKNE